MLAPAKGEAVIRQPSGQLVKQHDIRQAETLCHGLRRRQILPPHRPHQPQCRLLRHEDFDGGGGAGGHVPSR